MRLATGNRPKTQASLRAQQQRAFELYLKIACIRFGCAISFVRVIAGDILTPLILKKAHESFYFRAISAGDFKGKRKSKKRKRNVQR